MTELELWLTSHGPRCTIERTKDYALNVFLFRCRSCRSGIAISREALANMIVQGAFSQLLVPGLRSMLRSNGSYAYAYSYCKSDAETVRWIEERERMAELHPDTSQIPRWRQPARQHEAPIKAWRCWELKTHGFLDQGDFILASVAADTEWEGPVIRSDQPPLDPKVWDKAKRENAANRNEITAHVFGKAGIHAVKTQRQVEKTARMYASEVYGEVTLWGRVAQFELGYRAEYCMIKKLYLIRALVRSSHTLGCYPMENIAKALSNRYQCDVEVV